jgi:hypothetical protein
MEEEQRKGREMDNETEEAEKMFATPFTLSLSKNHARERHRPLSRSV